MSQVDLRSNKDLVEQMLRNLPEDCTLEDIQYHLYVLQKIQHRLQLAEHGEFASHEEVEQRMARWLNL